jgi:hypothetical protein
MATSYRVLNIALHGLHLAVVGFLLTGWILVPVRPYHLAFIVGTLAAWGLLGYCPLTEWHWRVRQAAGLGRPTTPYIPFLAAQLGVPVDPVRLDKAVTTLTVGVALLSAGLAVASHWKT